MDVTVENFTSTLRSVDQRVQVSVVYHSVCSENNSCLLDHATVPSHVQGHRGSRLQLDPGQRELRADLVPGADHRCCCVHHSSGRNYLLLQLSIKIYIFQVNFVKNLFKDPRDQKNGGGGGFKMRT